MEVLGEAWGYRGEKPMTEHHVKERMELGVGQLCSGPGCVISGHPYPLGQCFSI